MEYEEEKQNAKKKTKFIGQRHFSFIFLLVSFMERKKKRYQYFEVEKQSREIKKELPLISW